MRENVRYLHVSSSHFHPCLLSRRSLSNLYEKRGTLKKRMSTDQAIKVNLQIVHFGIQHLDVKISDSVSQVMGLDDDYSREDIDETLKNHSQDIGVCYFHRQKVQFAWMGAKHFEIQKTFPLFYLESEHFFSQA